MREIRASDIEAQYPSLLDDVRRGEAVSIIRDGKAVAHIVSASPEGRPGIARAVEQIRAVRLETKPMTAAEILAARDEGRS